MAKERCQFSRFHVFATGRKLYTAQDCQLPQNYQWTVFCRYNNKIVQQKMFPGRSFLRMQNGPKLISNQGLSIRQQTSKFFEECFRSLPLQQQSTINDHSQYGRFHVSATGRKLYTAKDYQLTQNYYWTDFCCYNNNRVR